MKRITVAALIVIVILLALALVACGGDDDPAPWGPLMTACAGGCPTPAAAITLRPVNAAVAATVRALELTMTAAPAATPNPALATATAALLDATETTTP